MDELNDEVARWEDPAYIETQARERLYYVLPGDVSYLVVGDAGATVGEEQAPVSDEIQTTQTDWMGALLSRSTRPGSPTPPRRSWTARPAGSG